MDDLKGPERYGNVVGWERGAKGEREEGERGVVCRDCAWMRRSKPHRGSQNDETPECLGSAGKPEKQSSE